MRPIKFKGKRIDNNEWIFGDLLNHSIIDPFTYISKGIGYKVTDPEIGVPIKVYPDSVAQYTGLDDKHNVEIYEKDKVRLPGFNPEIYTVDFIEGAFCFTHPNIEEYPIDINMVYTSSGINVEVIK